MNNFCTRPSRLFSGEPDALFAQDSALYSFSTTIENNLSSPFNFDLEGDSVPSTVQWRGSKMQLTFFNPINGLSGIESDNHGVRIYLCPPQSAGVLPFTPPLVFNNNAVGLELQKQKSVQIDEFPAGFFKMFFVGKIDVPPQWNIKIVIQDGNAGVNFLRAGTIVTFSMLRAIVPIDFATKS